MKLLENIIKKALFETRQLLVEDTEETIFENGLTNSLRNKVESIAPNAIKGFRLIFKGGANLSKRPDAISNSFANFLKTRADVSRTVDPEKGDEPLGTYDNLRGLSSYLLSNNIVLYGDDIKETRAEKKFKPVVFDIYNFIILKTDTLLNNLMYDTNTIDLLNKLSVNAWKYPAASGSPWANPLTGLANLDIQYFGEKVGQSAIISVTQFGQQRESFMQFLPIAREMKNTPQPGADPNRNDDIDAAINIMESFVNYQTNFSALSKLLAPKADISVTAINFETKDNPSMQQKLKSWVTWDATDVKQAFAIKKQIDTDLDAQGDTAAIAADNTVVDVNAKEYETTLSPSGKIAFTGKWNLELDQPIDGTAKDAAGNKWNGQWDANGEFTNGVGYKKLSDGAEWRGGFLRGYPTGTGKYKSATITFDGEVEIVNKMVAPIDGKIYEKWPSPAPVSGKFNSYAGDIANGKRVDGALTYYVSESGITVEYIFTGTFDSNEQPKDGEVIKDGDYANPYGTFANSVFTKN